MMNTQQVPRDDILGQLPEELRRELLDAYGEVTRNYRERRWEPSELNGGKLCEVAYTILRGHVDGHFPSQSVKAPNMVDACRHLEQASSTAWPRSVRIQIPRMIIALYEIRNNRGVGHAGGDVDPNQMDANCVLSMSKWIVAELVRVFHKVDTQAATAAVESLTERVLPVVWEVDGKLRVLDTRLTMKSKVLVLLYHSPVPVDERDLLNWVEHSNSSVFRSKVLRPMHNEKLIEYSPESGNVHLSPKGSAFVEETILSQ